MRKRGAATLAADFWYGLMGDRLSGAPDDEHWRQFGRLVFQTRLRLGFANQRQFAEAAGVHWQTIRKLEAGEPVIRRNPSWSDIEKALGWAPGSIERVWRGGQLRGAGPVVTDDFAQEVTRVLIDVAPELTGGQIRDIARGIEQIAVERGWVVSER